MKKGSRILAGLVGMGVLACGGSQSTTSPPQVVPVAQFTFSCAHLACAFTDQSDGGGPGGAGIASRQWRFGDGSAAAINVTLPNHTYTTPGTYAVTLSVTNVQSVTDSVSAALAVDKYPIARFDGNCTVSGSVTGCTFTDKSIDSTGVIVGWRWDFGDSSLSIKRNPAHQLVCANSGTGNCTGIT